MTLRTKRSRSRGLSDYKVYELLTGLIDYPVRNYTGYGNPAAEQSLITLTDQEPRPQHYYAVHLDHDGTKRYAMVDPFVSDAMEADWRAYRDRLVRFWMSREDTTTERLKRFGIDIRCSPGIFIRGCAGTRPWAWHCFDAPEPLPEGEDELEYLNRHGLLFKGERDMRAQQEQKR